MVTWLWERTSMYHTKFSHQLLITIISIASFPGPAQLSVACSMENRYSIFRSRGENLGRRLSFQLIDTIATKMSLAKVWWTLSHFCYWLMINVSVQWLIVSLQLISLTPLRCSPSSEPYASRCGSQEHSTHPGGEGGKESCKFGERVREPETRTNGRSASWHFVSWTQKMSGSSRLTYSIPPFWRREVKLAQRKLLLLTATLPSAMLWYRLRSKCWSSLSKA